MGSITLECLCNAIAYELAREGSLKYSKRDGCLTFFEIASRVKQDINALWRVTPFMNGIITIFGVNVVES